MRTAWAGLGTGMWVYGLGNVCEASCLELITSIPDHVSFSLNS